MRKRPIEENPFALPLWISVGDSFEENRGGQPYSASRPRYFLRLFATVWILVGGVHSYPLANADGTAHGSGLRNSDLPLHHERKNPDALRAPIHTALKPFRGPALGRSSAFEDCDITRVSEGDLNFRVHRGGLHQSGTTSNPERLLTTGETLSTF